MRPLYIKMRTLLTSLISTPERWLIQWLGGGGSKSGVTVNEDTAMQVTAVFACVRLLAETISSLPIQLLRLKNGGKEKAVNHPLYFILHNEPNPEQTIVEFMQVMIINALLTGRAIAEVVKNEAGNIVEMWPIPTGNVTITRNTSTKELMYQVRAPDGKSYTLYPENIFEFKWLTPNGIDVYKPLIAAREAIGLALATEQYGSEFFANGTNVGGVIEYDGKLSEPNKKTFRESVREKYEGLGKTNRLLFLESGSKFQKVTSTPNESQFIETRKFQVIEIARFFNVPPHLIMDLERATFSNIENQSLGFVIYSLRPWLVKIEQALQKYCLTQSEKKKYIIKFNVSALLRGDFKTRMDGYAIGRQNGWLSANDIRELEDINLIPDEQGGNIYLVNGNMIPITEASSDGKTNAKATELLDQAKQKAGGEKSG